MVFPLAVGLLFLAVCYAYYKHSRRRFVALAAKIQGPPAWPLIGNALEFMGSTQERLSQIVSTRIFKAWLHPDWIFHLTSLGREFAKELNRARHMAQKVVEQRKQKCVCTESDGSKKIFIDLLLEQSLSEQEVLDEVTTMLVAGNDTTATVSSFVLLALAVQQNAQERVREELRDIFGPDKRPATSNDLRQMSFLEMCIKETLRMFPVAPMLARRVTEDIKLTTSGLVLPAGCSVAICIQHMHRQPDIFPQPELFLPERFSGKEKRHPYSFLPFSAGPRNCVGLRYAMLLVKVMTSTILRHYRLSSPIKSLNDIILTLDILLKPVQGYPLILEPLELHK
ncbi:Cytochrome P450 4C1 [Blattella germanica]|nr:Cytochrome P450 4C1 [Blattella germanica]